MQVGKGETCWIDRHSDSSLKVQCSSSDAREDMQARFQLGQDLWAQRYAELAFSQKFTVLNLQY